MPSVSEFFGITILIYYNDHLPPHFHAAYAEYEALILIGTLELHEGRLPSRAHALVLEWAAMHREELMTDWDRARQGLPLGWIKPLE